MRLSIPGTRRDFLRAGLASTAATVGCATTGGSGRASPRALRTALCDLLNIDVPILQAGMAPLAGPELAAAVSEAGGLGIIAAAHQTPEEVRARIRRVRELTARPFGVNLLLHEDVAPPIDARSIPDDVVRAAQAALDRFRDRLGLPRSSARPETRPDHAPAAIEVILEERVSVFSVGLGNPSRALVDRCHAQGTKVIAMACTPEDARALADNGVDVVIAQGSEAGGHRSTWRRQPSAQHAAIGTLALVPQVVDAVQVPVVAAGGVSDGRGIVAALALGASGVLVGTRFVATRESRAAEFYKEALRSTRGDATVVTDAYSGMYARLIRNTFITEYDASGAPTLPGYLQSAISRDIVAAAAERRDLAHYPMWAGQGVGMIDDLPSAAELMARLVQESAAAMMSLHERTQGA